MTTNGRALSGRTMLVTGAAKRLGRAIALAAAENGADVAITYRECAGEGPAVGGHRVALAPGKNGAGGALYFGGGGGRGASGGGRAGAAWRGGAGGAMRCYRREECPRNGEGSGEGTGRNRRTGE